MKNLPNQESALRTAVPPGLTGDIFKDTELVEAKVSWFFIIGQGIKVSWCLLKIFHICIFLGERSLSSSKSWGGSKREAETGTDDKGLKNDQIFKFLN